MLITNQVTLWVVGNWEVDFWIARHPVRPANPVRSSAHLRLFSYRRVGTGI